jgi:hypothetical protein
MTEEKKSNRIPDLRKAFDEMKKPDDRPEVVGLLAAIKRTMPALEKLLARCDDHWGVEDGVYRFYHRSWKVYGLQDLTVEMVEALKALAPPGLKNEWTEMIEEPFARNHRV